jgi:prepilin-type N-terminal cleavage/methylation domain-containing protein
MLRSPAVYLVVHRRHLHGGFTLVELLLVIALIAGLAGLALGAMPGVKQRAATGRARAELALLSQALERYRQLHGDYPQVADSPETFYAALAGRVGPTGSALRGPNLADGLGVTCRRLELTDGAGCFVDPWDNPYQYVYFTRPVGSGGTQRGYVLYSFGPRTAMEARPTRAEVVPFTSGPQGGVVARSTLNAKNLYAGP